MSWNGKFFLPQKNANAAKRTPEQQKFHRLSLVVEPTPLKTMLVKMDIIFPNCRGENLKICELPPPSRL